MLQFITRGRTLTAIVPKIYFSSHPDDFERYFRLICADIFSVQENCAIFYDDGTSDVSLDDELTAALKEMRLIVVPVTGRLLSQCSRAIEKELPFAINHNIPILPILVEEDVDGSLIEAFNSSDIFAGMQFLNKYDTDSTALPYIDKLKTFIASVLVSEAETKRIQEEFSSSIFLSYRKKDRALAQELMRRIHKVDICRDTAIWYDEYLVPGESFDADIMEALDGSDAFVMSVSPAFEEHGNYVAAHEYPDAVRKGKPLAAAKMEHFDETSLKNLEGLYPGINALMVDPDDLDSFGKTLKQLLTEDAGLKESELLDNDGEHLYYIALAYKNGVRTEADPKRAAGLFEMSAENGFYEAYIKLIKMYRMGDGTERNYEAALKVSNRALDVLRPLAGSFLRTDHVMAFVYSERGIIFSETNRRGEAIEAYGHAYETRKRMHAEYEKTDIGEYCESMMSLAAMYFSDGDFEKAISIAEEFVSDTGLLAENEPVNTDDAVLLRVIARLCSLMSAAYIQCRNHSKAAANAVIRAESLEKLETITGSVEDLRDLAAACIACADLMKISDLNAADGYIQKYSEISNRLAECEGDRPKTISDAIDTFSIADNVLMSISEGNEDALARAETLYGDVLETCSELMNSSNRYNAIILSANVYKRFGEMKKIADDTVGEVLEQYSKSLEICNEAEREFRNDLQLMHIKSGLLDQIGSIYLGIGDLTNATQYFTDALEIDMRTSRLKKDPGSMHNLARSYMRCAEVNMKRGHQPVADVNHRSALKILEPLADETDDYRILEDLAFVLLKLGESDRFSADQRIDYYGRAADKFRLLMEITNHSVEYVNHYNFVQERLNMIS